METPIMSFGLVIFSLAWVVIYSLLKQGHPNTRKWCTRLSCFVDQYIGWKDIERLKGLSDGMIGYCNGLQQGLYV
jgi:hypothetical protein